MTPNQEPPVLHFGIPEKLQPHVRISTTFPDQYKQHCLKFSAETMFVEAPAGTYLSQTFAGAGWEFCWHQGFLSEKVRIRPFVATPSLTLCCVLKGSANWRLQGQGKLMLIEKEFGLYYIPSQSQQLADLRAGEYEMLSVTLAPEFFQRFTEQYPSLGDIYQHRQKRSRRGSMLPPMRMDANDLKLLQELKQLPSTANEQPGLIQEKLQQLLTHYFNALSPRYAEGGEQVRKLRQICAYIQNHYHQPLSITELSNRAGMHINTFERTFKELLGISPRGYVEHLRMKKAAVLLSQTSLSIKEISSSTGYSGANYFTSVFRKHHRCSPREYRKNRLS